MQAMSKPGTWGDELTLRAACDLFGVTIRCITSGDSNWYITYRPRVALLPRELFLAYISPIHYNTLRCVHHYSDSRYVAYLCLSFMDIPPLSLIHPLDVTILVCTGGGAH